MKERGIFRFPRHSQRLEGVLDGLSGQLEEAQGVERGQLGDLRMGREQSSLSLTYKPVRALIISEMQDLKFHQQFQADQHLAKLINLIFSF